MVSFYSTFIGLVSLCNVIVERVSLCNIIIERFRFVTLVTVMAVLVPTTIPTLHSTAHTQLSGRDRSPSTPILTPTAGDGMITATRDHQYPRR